LPATTEPWLPPHPDFFCFSLLFLQPIRAIGYQKQPHFVLSSELRRASNAAKQRRKQKALPSFQSCIDLLQLSDCCLAGCWVVPSLLGWQSSAYSAPVLGRTIFFFQRRPRRTLTLRSICAALTFLLLMLTGGAPLPPWLHACMAASHPLPPSKQIEPWLCHSASSPTSHGFGSMFTRPSVGSNFPALHSFHGSSIIFWCGDDGRPR
jgi:hypothetical protein